MFFTDKIGYVLILFLLIIRFVGQGVEFGQGDFEGTVKSTAITLYTWYKTNELLLSDEARDALALKPDWSKNLRAVWGIDCRDQLTDKAAINARFKLVNEAVTFADKVLRPPKDKSFASVRKRLRQATKSCDELLLVLERVRYFTQQIHWLDSHFPGGVFRDVEGLCKIASRADIAEQQYSLNPGIRYVRWYAFDVKF